MAHFYEKTDSGVEPRHFVSMASRPGELRPTRLTDARKAGWYPSVTTVMGMLDKPALNDWRVTEHLKVAYDWCNLWGKPKELSQSYEDVNEWMREIKECTQEALDKAPKDGTDFHDSMEKYSKGLPVPEEHGRACYKAFARVLEETGVAAPNWINEESFVHPMGFAGKVDAHTQLWCLDWKSKNTSDKWKPGKMAYPEMAMQLAAYRVGLGLDNARCANVFICLDGGMVEFYEWNEEELSRQWENFSDLLKIWLRNAQYIPGHI